jgi:hypothetical protein
MTKKHFRWLVTASIAASIAGVVVSFLGESTLPAPLRAYLAARWSADSKASGIILLFVAIPLLIAGVVSIIGLYRFWRFSRPLTVIVWVIGFILQASIGPTVDSALATSLYELAAVLTGIILAVVYMPPAKAWFDE